MLAESFHAAPPPTLTLLATSLYTIGSQVPSLWFHAVPMRPTSESTTLNTVLKKCEKPKHSSSALWKGSQVCEAKGDRPMVRLGTMRGGV